MVPAVDRLFSDADVEPATYGVGELTRVVAGMVARAFPAEVWVRGVVANRSDSTRDGGRSKVVFFDLVDPGQDRHRPGASLKVVLFDKERQRVNAQIVRDAGGAIRIDDGTEVRIRGRLALHEPRSQLQVVMSAIDPAFTLGRLAADREALLKRLDAEGLLARNRTLALPRVPLRVALVTSAGSAAHADFAHELERSGFRWDLTVLSCRVQGDGAVGSVTDRLVQASVTGFDVVALVRGGGARTELAVFDHEDIARAIAASAVPVVTGIGHEVDRSVADEVAHLAHKTPTACAAALVERVAGFVADAERTWASVAATAARRLVTEHSLLRGHAGAVGRATATGLAVQGERLAHLSRSLERAAASATVRADGALAQRATRVGVLAAGSLEHAHRRVSTSSSGIRAARTQLALADARLDAVAAVVSAADPARALSRGWSVTRTAAGHVVRSPADVGPGQELITQLAGGTVHSVVSGTRTDVDVDVGPQRPDPSPRDPSGATPAEPADIADTAQEGLR